MKKKGTKQRIAVLTVLLAATLFFGCFGFVPATAQEGHDSSLSGVDNGR